MLRNLDAHKKGEEGREIPYVSCMRRNSPGSKPGVFYIDQNKCLLPTSTTAALLVHQLIVSRF